MNPNLKTLSAVLLPGLFVTPALAQDVHVKIAPAKSDILQYSITTKSEIKNERKTLVNGEERQGRGGRGGGGGGASSSIQKLVFQEGPAGTGWRRYVTAEAVVSSPARGGGDAEPTKVAGALAGKLVFLSEAEGRTIVKASADGEAMQRQLGNGVPASLDLGGFVPQEAVAVGSEFDLGAGFATSMANILHPVVATPAARGQRGGGRGQGGGGRGQGGGGRGQGGGGRGQGGRRQGGRGGQRRGRGATTFNVTAIQMLASEKLKTAGHGKLVSVEEKDGQKFATIQFDAKLSAAGTPQEVGTARGGRGGRGGQGGQRRGGQATPGKAELQMHVTGQIVVNQTESRVAAMSLDGKVSTKSETTRTRNRGGEDSKTVTTQSTNGSFQVAVVCTNEGAPKAPAKKVEKLIK